MNLAVIADPDRMVQAELAGQLEAAGFECHCPSPSELPLTLAAKGGNDLRLVILHSSLPGFKSLAEESRIAAPQGIVVALADIDARQSLTRAVVEGLVDDFLPLPFSGADIQGILKILKGRMR